MNACIAIDIASIQSDIKEMIKEKKRQEVPGGITCGNLPA